MGGDQPQQAAIFSYISPEERVPPEHPLAVVVLLTGDDVARLRPGYLTEHDPPMNEH